MIVTIMHNGRQAIYEPSSIEFRNVPSIRCSNLELRLIFPPGNSHNYESLTLHQFDGVSIAESPKPSFDDDLYNALFAIVDQFDRFEVGTPNDPARAIRQRFWGAKIAAAKTALKNAHVQHALPHPDCPQCTERKLI